MLRLPGWLSWVFVLFAIPSSTLHAQYLNEIWQLSDSGYNLGLSGSYSTDLDGDGKEEILYTNQFEIYTDYNYQFGARFFVLSHTEEGYAITYASQVFKQEDYYYDSRGPIGWLAVANLDGDEDQEIYVLLDDGRIQVFDGSTLAVVDTLSLDAVSYPRKMQITDVDDDGIDEFVVLGLESNYSSSSYLKIFDTETLALERETTGAISDFEIGDVDGDGASEIVTSHGLILDGATMSSQWQYGDGFGGMLELAQTDDDPALEILAYDSARDRLIAFDGEFETPLWEISDRYGSSFTATDIDDDGVWEIFLGSDTYNSRLIAYNASTREVLWSIDDGPSEAVSMIVGDPDGDGEKELIVGSNGYYSSDPSRLAILDGKTGAVEYKEQSLGGPFYVHTGEFDGQPGSEIVVSARDRTNGYNGSIAIVYGGADHGILWKSLDNQDLRIYDDFTGFGVGDTDDDERAELFISQYDQTVALHGWPLETRWKDTGLRSSRVFGAGDVDRDGDSELVLGNSNGQIYLLEGDSPAVIWQSITTESEIGGVRLANLDDDDALEIAFFNQNGRVHVYDGATHFLEWQSTEIADATSLDVADLDRDGQKELIVGHEDGYVTVLESGSFTVVDRFKAADAAVSGLRVGNLDESETPELLIAGSNLKVLNWPEKDTLWQSLDYGTALGKQDGIQIVDVDLDGYMDVLVAGAFGLIQFESSVRYPDVTPPYLREATPAPGATFVSRDQSARLRLSEPVDATALEMHLSVRADAVDVGFSAEAEMSFVEVSPIDLWPASSEIEITILGTLADSAGNGFDGNRNELSEGSPDDDLAFSFFTGSGVDSIGPSVASFALEADSVWFGTRLRVSGLLTDTSSVAVSLIAAAEYFVDEPGESGEGVPVLAADSLFDGIEEGVSFTVDTDELAGGEHMLWLHGRDTRGNWGTLAPISFYVIVSEGSEWAQYGQNAQHTGFNARDSIRAPLELEWNTSPIEGYLTAPIVVGDRIFVSAGRYSQDNVLLAIDIETGQEAWSTSFGSISGISMPAFAYGRVYVQSSNSSSGSYVTAFEAQTGRQEWKSPFRTYWSGSFAPTVADGKVFVNAGYYDGITTYDAFTGRELWLAYLPQEFNGAPTYYQGTVYSAWSDASYHAIDAESGEMKYQHGNAYDYGYTAVVKDNVLYTTNPIAAIDLESHQTRWSKSASTTPALAYDKVFAVAFGTLNAYDEASGATLWSFNPSDDLLYEPVVANGFVFVSSETKTHAVDAESGAEVWSHEVGGRLAVANDRLFISGIDGSLYAFKESDSIVDSEDETAFPRTYALEPNYPNPFSIATTIPYELPTAGPVRLEVYNALGQKVTTLVNEFKAAGRYEQAWDAGSLGSGQYFYRITAGDFTAVRPMALVK